MINDILNGIMAAIHEAFPDEKYTIYPEKIPQDLETPAFFVKCINPTVERFSGLYGANTRRETSNTFVIQYFPEDSDTYMTFNDVFERLASALEFITVNGVLVIGTEPAVKNSDETLTVTIDYNVPLITKVDDQKFEELELKEGVTNG